MLGPLLYCVVYFRVHPSQMNFRPQWKFYKKVRVFTANFMVIFHSKPYCFIQNAHHTACHHKLPKPNINNQQTGAQNRIQLWLRTAFIQRLTFLPWLWTVNHLIECNSSYKNGSRLRWRYCPNWISVWVQPTMSLYYVSYEHHCFSGCQLSRWWTVKEPFPYYWSDFEVHELYWWFAVMITHSNPAFCADKAAPQSRVKSWSTMDTSLTSFAKDAKINSTNATCSK